MTVYFDTNIYRFARQAGEISRIRQTLNRFGADLILSAGNIFETLAIESASTRLTEAEAIVELGPTFEKYPESWLHAQELLKELQRKRRSWIRSVVYKRSMRDFLKAHRAVWDGFKQVDLRSASNYAQYRRDFEDGVDQNRGFQKELRATLPKVNHFRLQSPNGQSYDIDMSDPEAYWRMEGMIAWYQAIVVRSPASRDYADWLGPYIKQGSFQDPSYELFWFRDAAAEKLPLNRLTGLVSFYQLEHKITHGNAADEIHATNWLLNDLFFTADRAFYSVLDKVAWVHFPDFARPILIDRSATSCVDQVEARLEEHMTLRK